MIAVSLQLPDGRTRELRSLRWSVMARVVTMAPREVIISPRKVTLGLQGPNGSDYSLN